MRDARRAREESRRGCTSAGGNRLNGEENMRTVLLIAAALILAAGVSACRESGDTGGGSGDFRNAKWGMTKDEVKASEKLTLSDELPEAVTYVGELGGKPAIIGYVFNEEGQLIRAGYLVDDEQIPPDDYVAAFEKAKKDMGVGLGMPSTDRMLWTSGVQDVTDPEKFGEATCEGKMRYLAGWADERTAINLTLDGYEGKCRLAAMYDSMDFYVLPAMLEKSAMKSAGPTPGPGAE